MMRFFVVAIVILFLGKSSSHAEMSCFDIFKLHKYDVYSALVEAGTFRGSYPEFMVARAVNQAVQVQLREKYPRMDEETLRQAARIIGTVEGTFPFLESIYAKMADDKVAYDFFTLMTRKGLMGENFQQLHQVVLRTLSVSRVIDPNAVAPMAIRMVQDNDYRIRHLVRVGR